MITVTFTYAGLRLPTGLHAVHLYVKRENDGGFDLSPRAEKLAMNDAELIVRDIVRVNEPQDDDRLLQDGEPPSDSELIAKFKIAIRWDRKLKMATYHRAGHERFAWEAKWQPVAALMMEQYDYTMSVLRNREKSERKEKSKK